MRRNGNHGFSLNDSGKRRNVRQMVERFDNIVKRIACQQQSPLAWAIWPMAWPSGFVIQRHHGQTGISIMNILLVDDHPLFREGMSLLLHSLLDDAITFQAGSVEEALAHLAQQVEPIELMLIDIGLPGMSGLEGLTVVRRDYPDIPVVVLSSNDDRESVLSALDRGAMGFVPKSSSSKVLEAALNLILAKGVYLPANVFLSERAGTDIKLSPLPPGTSSANALNQPVTCAQLGLTPRQSDVLHLVLQGKSTKAICRDLNLSVSTIKTHTSAALRALNVTTRTQAVIAASKLGLRFAD
jgi:DNA-binding NarL/FixJ family response regulator